MWSRYGQATSGSQRTNPGLGAAGTPVRLAVTVRSQMAPRLACPTCPRPIVETPSLSARPLPQLAESRPRLDSKTSPLTVRVFAALQVAGLAITGNRVLADIHET